MTPEGGRVLGIGGVFVAAADPAGLRAWYARVLGFGLETWGGAVFPPLPRGVTVWSAFEAPAGHFAPSERDVMVNLVVDDLDAMLSRIRAAGVEPLDRNDTDTHGRFAWLLDPAGMKIELWEPAAS